jgi:integrase
MLQLNNGCSCSKPSINPKNWNQPGASIKKDWYIQYYFYDPTFKERYKNGRLTIVKGGINQFKTLAERRQAAKILLAEEIRMLTEEDYNPITGYRLIAPPMEYEIDPATPFIEALKMAMGKIRVEKSTASDLASVIRGVELSARQLRISHIRISEVRRKHIKSILENLMHTNERFTANRFNKYRSYLMMLFTELVELEAVESNPVREIRKQKVLQKQRILLTQEERTLINAELQKHHYEFWRFLIIFFHSGGREAELLRLRYEDIDLVNQRYKTIVRKGTTQREQLRTIKDVAVYFWQELMSVAKPGDYIFSKGLVPGKKPIRPDQITRRWRRHVKEKLGIRADFYSLKHLNLDETAAALDIQAAAHLAGHTTPVITLQHYALGEKDRIHDRLKKINNSFA